MKLLFLLILTPPLICESLNAAWADIRDYFDDYGATEQDGWYTTWVGKIYPDSSANKWFYQEQHKWQFIVSGSTSAPESITVWGDPMKWYWYSTSSVYPDMRRSSDWRWYTYTEGTSNPREFYDQTDQVHKIDLTQDVPAYDPSFWNATPTRQQNNCYNYATNTLTKFPLQFDDPGGYAGGSCADPAYTCTDIASAVGASCGNAMTPGDENGPVPEGKARVYMLVMDGEDYHFVRQDSDGYWSDKLSSANIVKHQIADPSQADWTPYDKKCDYYYLTTSSSTSGSSGATIAPH